MARLVINSDEFSEKLTGFDLKCRNCGSNKVTLDIDWAAYPSASWFRVDVICEDCKHEQSLVDSG